MDITAIIELTKALGLTPLSIVLLLLVLLLLKHFGISLKFWQSEERSYDDGKPLVTTADVANKLGTLQSSIFKLSEYYNHDTTQHQKNVEDKLDKVIDKLDTSFSVTRETNAKLVEFEKYGIICRSHPNHDK